MTTLFNLFSPIYVVWGSVKGSVLLLLFTGLFLVLLLEMWLTSSHLGNISSMFSMLGFSYVAVSVFCVLSISNLLSLVLYNFPITTTLGFNLSLALSLWLCSVLLQSVKIMTISSLLPSNTPWYLIPFLSIVELVSIVVRPVTLCFRLLANMSAGHILLTLICKMPLGLWILGCVFGLLELMVSLVQAFVFLMLIGVYLEESLTH